MCFFYSKGKNSFCEIIKSFPWFFRSIIDIKCIFREIFSEDGGTEAVFVLLIYILIDEQFLLQWV